MWEYGFWQLMETWFTDPLHITGISYGAKKNATMTMPSTYFEDVLPCATSCSPLASHVQYFHSSLSAATTSPQISVRLSEMIALTIFQILSFVFQQFFFSPWEALSSARGDFELLCNGARLHLSGAAQWQRFQRQHPLARNNRTIFSETTGDSGEEIQLDRPGIWRAMLKNQGTTDFAEFPR